jgi:hypothetical protein
MKMWRSSGLAGLAGFSVAALLFGTLIVAVRVRWLPLESVDRGVVGDLNRVVADHPVAWVLVFGVLCAIGVPLARYHHGNGNTHAILFVGLIAALRALAHQPFGVYCFIQSRYRKVGS